MSKLTEKRKELKKKLAENTQETKPLAGRY